MDEGKEIVDQFDLLKNTVIARFRDVKADRDRIKSKLVELNTNFQKLLENHRDTQDENNRLKSLNADLEIRNAELQSQLQTSEAVREKLQEKLNNIMTQLKDSQSETNIVKFNEEEIHLDPDVEDKLKNVDSRNVDLRDDEREDIESMKDIDFPTQFYKTEEYNVPENNVSVSLNLSTENHELLNKIHATPPPKRKIKSDVENEIMDVVDDSKVEEAKPKTIIPETVDDDNIVLDVSEFEKTPNRNFLQNVNMSPVFRDLSGRKRRSSITSEGNEINSSVLASPLRLVPTRNLLKPIQETLNLSSPVKRTSSAIINQSTPEKPNTPKRTKKSPRQRTPKKSPLRRTPKKSPSRASQLKKSNFIETEWTQNGYKKMKQTKLDINSFRSQKVSEKENSLDKDEDVFKQALDQSLEKILQVEKDNIAVNDDDVILDSPNRSQVRSSLKFGRKAVAATIAIAGSSKNVPPSQSLLSIDPEATYVSNSYISNWEGDREKLDKIVEEKTPEKKYLSPTERLPSPNSSPPFAYKREAVRKKSERMKLPGHYCFECEKYYRSTYGDQISDQDLQKIMDKCSRHRDKHPDLNNTPPGYWKPYMTMSSSEFHKSDF